MIVLFFAIAVVSFRLAYRISRWGLGLIGIASVPIMVFYIMVCMDAWGSHENAAAYSRVAWFVFGFNVLAALIFMDRSIRGGAE